MCADCRREDHDIRKILDGAGALQSDIHQAMESVDWDGFAERVADAALERRRRPAAATVRPMSFWASLFGRPWVPVLATLAAGAVLGAAVMYFIAGPGNPGRRPPVLAAASGEFIDRVELSLAKRETIDYLGRSRALLLDFVQATPEDAAQSLRSGEAAGRARDLLAKKRYINSGLETDRMAKARDICNQIEILFTELAHIGEDLTPEDAARIQRFVEDRNFLLRIRLIRKELAENEV